MRKRSFVTWATAGVIMLMTASVHAVIYTVTNNNDSGPGSFRQALLDADASGGNDYINFQDVGTITIASSLVINDGNLYLGNSNQSIEVTIDAHTTGFDALVVYGSNVVIRNLAFVRTSSPVVSGTAIDIRSDFVYVVGCRVGTDWGDSNDSNFYTGINVQGTAVDSVQYARIGYRLGQADERCIIARNVTGIRSVYTANLMIANNYIGLNSSGDTEMATSYGILLDNGTVQALVGSFLPTVERNVICGTNTGIRISGAGAASYGNSITAVWMNVHADGTPAGSHNFATDILLDSGAEGNFIGRPGSSGSAGNLIYGAYIAVSGTAHHNAIMGNTLIASGSSKVIDLIMAGSNDGHPAPVITAANPGLIQGTGTDTDTIEVFLADRGAGSRGGALQYIGTATVAGSNWSLVPSSLAGGEVITAISTDPSNNSSEFAINVLVQPPTPTSTMTQTFTPTPTSSFTPTCTSSTTATPTPTPTASPTISCTPTVTPTFTHSPTMTVTSTVSPTATMSPTPTTTLMATNTPDNPFLGVGLGGRPALPMPNPARNNMHFIVHLDQPAKVEIMIFNLAGERVARLAANLPAGHGQTLTWNCGQVAPGMYTVQVLKDGRKTGTLKVAVVH